MRQSAAASLRAKAAAWAFGATSATHLVAQIWGNPALITATKALLMPLLAANLLARAPAPERTIRLMLAGLGLSWLGDVMPGFVPDEYSFVTMVGFFLLAQGAYVTAFAPYVRRRFSTAERGPILAAAAAYGLALVALCRWCLPQAGPLAVPVVVYGLVLGAMATSSTAVNRLAGLGGLVFFVSDSLIALNAFAPGYDWAGHHVAVMGTYIAAQALLVAGVLRAEQPGGLSPIRPQER